jgi:hypothetical protein
MELLLIHVHAEDVINYNKKQVIAKKGFKTKEKKD